jgi:hypothetical protein
LEALPFSEVPASLHGLEAVVLPEHRSPRPTILGRIPSFPVFKPLEVTDRLAVESWAKQFPHSSDFNFVSLWSWNTDGSIELSWLNDNLVVRFKDYGTPARFYSFLGTNDVVATALTLCEAAREAGLEPRLQLIPEVVVAETPGVRDWVKVIPDRAQFDYVLSTEEWSTLPGGKFRKKRNVIHQLLRTRAPEFRPIDPGQIGIQRAILRLFGRWVVQRGRAGQPDTVAQAMALKRFFSLDRPGDLLSYGVFIDGQLCAYTINEPLTAGYAMGHFWRADRTAPGLYPFLLRETCRALRTEGYRYLNTMQDLGHPGLAHAKGLDRPHHFLRKYTLAPLDTAGIVDGFPARDDAISVLVKRPVLVSMTQH